MFFHVLTHVETQEGDAHALGKLLGEFRLADPGGSIEEERTGGTIRPAEPGPRTQDGAGHDIHRFILPKQHGPEVILERLQAVAFLARYGAGGNPGHTGHNTLHVLTRNRRAGLEARTQPHGSPGLIHDVDGLVRQQAILHMAGGKLHRRPQGRRGVTHVMVLLIVGLEAFENVHALVQRRLLDIHFLKTPGQRAVLFKVVAELVVGRRADAAELAFGKDGLQQVGSVHRAAAGGTGTHNSMDFVNKQDRAGDLLQRSDHGLDAAFEVAAVTRPGEHGPEIKGVYLRILELRRHIAADDAQGQTFRNGGLPGPGIAHVQRIVLTAPGEDFDGARQLHLASDQRIELSFAGAGRQVHGVTRQGVLGRFGTAFALSRFRGRFVLPLFVVVGDALQHGKPGDALLFQAVGSPRVFLFLKDGGEHVADLNTDVLVPSRAFDVRQRAVQHTLDGKRLVNVFGGLVEALHIGLEKMIEGLPQHGGTAAAPFDELPSGRLGCDAVKDMLQRQVFMPTPFQLLHRKA